MQPQEIGIVLNRAIDTSATDACVRIKDLGYSSSHHIHMYGERFEIVSDPFPDGNGVGVLVTTVREPAKRTLRLPTSILMGLNDLFPNKSQPKVGGPTGTNLSEGLTV